MKKWLGLTLGVLSAVGGFVDIGDIVENGLVGARYGMSLTWVIVLGVIGIATYAHMSGRIVAVSGRPVYDLVRERLGAKAALANLVGSLLITLLTLAAEIGGVALVIELATGVDHLVWVLLVGVGLWLVVWRVRFQTMEQTLGFAGLAVAVFVVAVFCLDPDWGTLGSQVVRVTPPEGEPLPTYLYHAIALFGSAMTPYEVFFFSSGGVEEKWSRADLAVVKMNSFVGFPLGGLLGLGIAAATAAVLLPAGVQVDNISQVLLPVALSLGGVGLVIGLFGFAATTVGAALETGLSAGYAVAQFFGWEWGKRVRPAGAARFHLAVALSLLAGALVVQTGVDPVALTEYSLVFSAVALPLTYLPVLIVANDTDYLGEHVNGRISNTLGLLTLVVVVLAAAAAIPLMIATGAGA
ncbi:NRAMP family divalent metal transporter [Goodfellowiella coeruleoviolacea]|uniref:Mn2+ and Fe2+ transporters of the NRAMP family n=1 Tax=Goodfellowiella coeruleoviolacea TaxID=334858 RepID=A0AAE3GBR6_9PSEU|nr:divalent metal cation transporter [Goodfellowiella coeruleoviolacea]MCP2165371.1 Mn2+ and Fe2+ transporters of the NRAMP family [Goodfellowiella coeruleoviolacea]